MSRDSKKKLGNGALIVVSKCAGWFVRFFVSKTINFPQISCCTFQLRCGQLSALIVLLSAVHVPVQAYEFCGNPLDGNAFNRPIDYNDRSADTVAKIQLVESYHFTRKVELLEKGQSGPIVIDLGYTLRQIPNHYRALAAMDKWQSVNGYTTEHEEQHVYTTDCYYRRAIIFRPKDPNLHLLYAIFYHRNGRLQDALKEYEVALQLGPNNAELHYNFGLLYFDLKSYDLARAKARRAYELGFPLIGLKSKLQRVGEWQENKE